MTRRLLVAYVSLCAYLVLVLQALSLFQQVVYVPVLVGTIVGLVFVVRLSVPHPRSWSSSLRGWGGSVSPRVWLCPSTIPFVLVLPPLLVFLVVQGWHFPVNDWDALTVHLARAAYWRQFHTLAHFSSNYEAQVAFPGNVSALFTVFLVLMSSARATFLVSIFAYVMGSVAVYGLGRQAGARPAYALFGAGLYATMPEVVLQSNSTMCDISIASFALCATYFFVDYVQTRTLCSVVFAGAALGLAIGIKETAALPLPGLLLAGVFLVRDRGLTGVPERGWLAMGRVLVTRPQSLAGALRPATLAALAGGVLLAVLLAAPWYVENRVDYGSFFGPTLSGLFTNSPITLAGLWINIWRHLIAFLDPAGPLMVFQSPKTSYCSTAGAWCQHVADLRTWLAAITGADTVDPAIEWPYNAYSPTPYAIFSLPVTWFGFTGAMAVYVSLLFCARSIVRRRASVAALCAAGAASFLITDSLLLRMQQPWEGHIMTLMAGLCCPAVAVVAQRLGAHRAGIWLLCAIAVYGAAGAPVAAVLNQWRPVSSWNESYAAQEAAVYPGMIPVLQAIDRLLPSDARVGLLIPGTGHDWELPFFGPDLTRTVIPIKLPLSTGLTIPGAPDFSYAAPFDYLAANLPDNIVGQFFAAHPSMRCVQIWRNFSWSPPAWPFTFFRCVDVTAEEMYEAALGDQYTDYSGELLQLNELARIDPHYKSEQFARGWAEWNLGQRDAAIVDYRAYLQYHPDDAQAQLNLGYSLIRMGRCREAIAPLRKVLQLQPTNAAASQDLAVCKAG